jgi:hypothetical protein
MRGSLAASSLTTSPISVLHCMSICFTMATCGHRRDVALLKTLKEDSKVGQKEKRIET